MTESLMLRLQKLFFESKNKEYALKRLFNLCNKYKTNLYILNSDFSDYTKKQIDDTYLLIISF
jgi:hypothetical protein